jgi:hypothetical protein
MAYIAYPITKAHPPYGDICHDNVPVIVNYGSRICRNSTPQPYRFRLCMVRRCDPSRPHLRTDAMRCLARG